VILGDVTPQKPNWVRVRLGALALGLSAMLLTVFPLVRPFFPLDPRSPRETLAVASPSITSARWVVAHHLAMVAFVLLPFGMLALYAYLRAGLMEPRALRALAWSLAGIALIMPLLGFETYVLPILGRLYLAGTTAIAPVVGLVYLGPAIVVFFLGLLFLALGVAYLAVAIWQDSRLPRWAGVLFAIGLALWFPPFPRAVRIIDGLLIGLGGLWLASSMWRAAEDTQRNVSNASPPAALHDR
jgi:hypothetical protein